MKTIKKITAITLLFILFLGLIEGVALVKASGTEYSITVHGGKATPSSSVAGGKVKLSANPPEEGQVFSHWDVKEDLKKFIANLQYEGSGLTMPNEDMEITAIYKPAYNIVVNEGKVLTRNDIPITFAIAAE
ncbi:MAG: hypothetical protein GX666_02240 [Tissierellia bacterium]|nr:hypothetical protein [Tissierellia bacterium]